MIDITKPLSQSYRNDIDVLRAIAVGGVIAFHYGLLHISGGFVGVDIFFVISGFLISGQILSSTINNRFSLKEFLSRRFMRIYPALLATVIMVFIFSWAALDPKRFAQLSIDSEAALFGLSNIINYSDSGYFETPAQEKPLLHLWSIAVEIQFYLLCALILPRSLTKFGNENISKFLYIIIVANLLTSTYALFVDQSAAFYFLNNRIWEFCVGAFIAINSDKISLSQQKYDSLYLIGLSLIVISFFTFDAGSLFPGLSAAIPVLGTGLMIMSGKQSLVSKLIQNKLSLFIRKISYSLYLVHWPLFVFLSMYHHSLLQDRVAKYALLFAALIAGIILNRFIEEPYRREPKILALSVRNGFLRYFSCL
jgi:peptidoglycan/LPS O-acetylase OafA/YrhL